MPNYETYAGGHIATIYILPVLGGHVGAKNVFAENFGVRLDVETPLPYVVVGIFGLGLNAMYHQAINANTSFYAGAGGRALVGVTGGGSGAIFGAGILAGLEFDLDNIRLYVELDENFMIDPTAGNFLPIPIFRFGVNIPF